MKSKRAWDPNLFKFWNKLGWSIFQVDPSCKISFVKLVDSFQTWPRQIHVEVSTFFESRLILIWALYVLAKPKGPSLQWMHIAMQQFSPFSSKNNSSICQTFSENLITKYNNARFNIIFLWVTKCCSKWHGYFSC